MTFVITEPSDRLILYLHLARASELRQRPWVRDRFLVLAAVIADERLLPSIAAQCRRKILSNNAAHMLARYATVGIARRDPRFVRLVERLSIRYSRERAEHMLDSLGIDVAREAEPHPDELTYAAALLGANPRELEGAERLESPALVAADHAAMADRPRPRSEASPAGQVQARATAGLLPFLRERWRVLSLIGILLLAATVAVAVILRQK